MVYHTEFWLKPTDWRLWYDSVMLYWRAQRWDGNGGIISAQKLEANNMKFIAHGKYLRFPKAEVKVGHQNFTGEHHTQVDCFRLLPPSQRVEVPVIPMKSKSRV